MKTRLEKRRRQRASATIVVLILATVMVMMMGDNGLVLDHLEREIGLIEQRQVEWHRQHEEPWPERGERR